MTAHKATSARTEIRQLERKRFECFGDERLFGFSKRGCHSTSRRAKESPVKVLLWPLRLLVLGSDVFLGGGKEPRSPWSFAPDEVKCERHDQAKQDGRGKEVSEHRNAEQKYQQATNCENRSGNTAANAKLCTVDLWS